MYKNIYAEWSKIHIWDDTFGYKCMKYTPYIFEINRTTKTKYKTIYGDPVTKRTFKSYKDKKNYIEQISNRIGEKNLHKEIFESDLAPELDFLRRYEGNEPSNIRTWYIDIEVDSETCFPDVETAMNKITAITLYDTVEQKYFLFLLDEKREKLVPEEYKDNKIIFHIPTEYELIEAWLKFKKNRKPDMLIGWYADYFDYPYITNRFKHFGKAEELSEIGILSTTSFYDRKLKIRTEHPRWAGTSLIDFLSIYKKFSKNDRQSYSLEYISQYELGEGKVKYENSLDDLYNTDKPKFIEYCFTDVELMVMLEEKLGYIKIMRALCHMAHIPYEMIYVSNKLIDGAILQYCKKRNIVMPIVKKGIEIEGQYRGAFVQPTQVGKYNFIIDLDVVSLYPTMMIKCNISPEKKIGILIDPTDKEYILQELAKEENNL